MANQPFDEAHSLGSDGDLSSEDSVMTNDSAEMSPQPKSSAAADRPAAKAALESVARDRTAASITAAPLSTVPTPSPAAAAQLKSSASSGARGSGAGAGTNAAASESESDESDDDDDDESRAGAPVAGAYNPADYKHLPVNAEIKDLFQYISRYKPHEVELDSTPKCFIPDFIPAVGEMDAFIKVPPPDSSRDELGLKVLDEPAAQQSDATVLELQLRAGSKRRTGTCRSAASKTRPRTPRRSSAGFGPSRICTSRSTALKCSTSAICRTWIRSCRSGRASSKRHCSRCNCRRRSWTCPRKSTPA